MRRRAYNPLLKSYPDSERVNAVSMPAETLYTRLIAQSDDAGRYWGDARMVLGRLFTQRSIAGQVGEPEIEAMICELEAVGLVRRYQVREIQYIELVGVHKVNRRDVKRVVLHPDPPTGAAAVELHQDGDRGGTGDGEPAAGGAGTGDPGGPAGGSPAGAPGFQGWPESDSEAPADPGSDEGGQVEELVTVDPGPASGAPPRRAGPAPTADPIAPESSESSAPPARVASVTGPARTRHAPVTKARLKLQATSSKPQAKSSKLQATTPTGRIKMSWTDDRGWRGISDKKREEWGKAYPGLVIDQELMHMGTWLRANPRKANKKNWSRFIVGWLKKETRDVEARKDGSGSKRPGRGKERGARSQGIPPRDIPL